MQTASALERLRDGADDRGNLCTGIAARCTTVSHRERCRSSQGGGEMAGPASTQESATGAVQKAPSTAWAWSWSLIHRPQWEKHFQTELVAAREERSEARSVEGAPWPSMPWALRSASLPPALLALWPDSDGLGHHTCSSLWLSTPMDSSLISYLGLLYSQVPKG